MKAIAITLILFFISLQACAANDHHYKSAKKINGYYIKTLELADGEKMQYAVHYPKAFSENKNTKETFPLMLFLHGGIYNDEGVANAAKVPVLQEIKKGRDLPYFILSPYNPNKQKFWDENNLKQLLDHAIEHHKNIDTDRIYMAGLSRGAHGAWNMVMQHPDTFAALVAVSGAVATPYAVWINKNMPVWVFHGIDDDAIPVEESIDMVKKMRSLGSQVKLTLYPDVKHNAWDKAYSTDELYEWLSQQRRSDWAKAE